jgi:uncharacterized membrane protein
MEPDAEWSRVIAWVRREDPVRWILGGMVVVWAATFIRLGWLRHTRFGTYGFDLGIYDQGVWLLSRFQEPFVTVKGLNLFGHHMNPALLLLVPFYWLRAGPGLLLVVQVAAQASGAVAIYLLARDRLADRWLALVLAAVLLLHPTYQYLTWEFFHPDSLAIAPLLFAYWAARSKRWVWYLVAAVLAVACKEDVALAVGGLGVLMFFRGERRAGVATALGAFGWFVLSTRVLMRWALGGLSPFYDAFFPDFGRNAGEVLRGIVTRPRKVFDLATRPDRIGYYRMIMAPVAFLALAELPTLLLIGGPMLAVNALTSTPYARDFKYHNSALVVAGLAVATVEAVAMVGRTPSLRRFLVGLLAATSLATTVAWGPSPISTRYRSGIWPLTADPRTALKREALRVIPRHAAVSASYDLVPHLTHRKTIYQFPEPWTAVAWGIRGERLPDPGTVEWIVVDRQRFLSDDERRLFERLLGGEFRLRYDRDGIVAGQRIKPGGRLGLRP